MAKIRFKGKLLKSITNKKKLTDFLVLGSEPNVFRGLTTAKCRAMILPINSPPLVTSAAASSKAVILFLLNHCLLLFL